MACLEVSGRNPLTPLRRAALCALLLLAVPAVYADEKTSDATLSPQPAEIMPKVAQYTLLDIAYTGKRYVAVGDHGDIVISADGKEWKQVNAPVRAMLNRLRFLDASHGWAVGYDGSILNTADGGLTWSLQHFDAASGLPFFDVLFLDDQHGIAVGGNGLLLHTQDGGKTWLAVDTPLTALSLNFYSICRLNDGTLFITGEKGLLARSTDQGDSWQLLKSPYAGSSFGAVPNGSSGALVYGLRGNLYRADNIKTQPVIDPKNWDEFSIVTVTDPAVLKKIGWQRYDNPIPQSIFRAIPLDAQRILMVGVNGTVLVAHLDTAQLQPVPFTSDAPLSSAVVHGDDAIFVGRSGVQHLPAAKLTGAQ